MKITTRCGDDAVSGLNEALLAKAQLIRQTLADMQLPAIVDLASA